MVRHRKSPIRHSVKQHRREGYVVHQYMRGRGSRSSLSRFSSRKVLGKDEVILCEVEQKLKPKHCGRCDSDEKGFNISHEARLYTVHFKYQDGTVETIKTTAHSPRQSIRYADLRRKRKTERPVEVTTHNRIGKIVGKLAGKFIGGVKEAARYYGEERRKQREELIEEARAGSISARRALKKAGIEWRPEPPTPKVPEYVA